MWRYQQSTGELRDSDGALVATGYAGVGADKNKPESEGIANRGPIPRGLYRIGRQRDTESHGPIVMRLTPSVDNEMFQRAGFLIHGDSIVMPGAASQGCIILPRTIRLEIAASPDRDLEVIA